MSTFQRVFFASPASKGERFNIRQCIVMFLLCCSNKALMFIFFHVFFVGLGRVVCASDDYQPGRARRAATFACQSPANLNIDRLATQPITLM